MKSEETLLRLEAALKRILDGRPERIDQGRKLSVKACEEEAGLGNGSAYYYPEFVKAIKEKKAVYDDPQDPLPPNSDLQRLREEIKEERRIKNKYRNQLTTIREKTKQMAKDQTQMIDALTSSRATIIKLKNELSEERRKNITQIK